MDGIPHRLSANALRGRRASSVKHDVGDGRCHDTAIGRRHANGKVIIQRRQTLENVHMITKHEQISNLPDSQQESKEPMTIIGQLERSVVIIALFNALVFYNV